jgi:hypothetical protein
MLLSPGRAALAVVFIALVAWTLQSIFHTGLFTVVAVLLVWGQVASFFLPATFTLTREKVAAKGLVSKKEKAWTEFRSYYVDPGGLLLSPFVVRSRLEKFRGFSLQFHGNRDEVVAFVEMMMGQAGEREDDVGDEGPREGGGEARGAP